MCELIDPVGCHSFLPQYLQHLAVSPTTSIEYECVVVHLLTLSKPFYHSSLRSVFDVLYMYTGYFFTYYNTRITEERKAQIERVNEQVEHTPASLSLVSLRPRKKGLI